MKVTVKEFSKETNVAVVENGVGRQILFHSSCMRLGEMRCSPVVGEALQIDFDEAGEVQALYAEGVER